MTNEEEAGEMNAIELHTAEDNVGDGEQSLWHVCNDHAYDDSEKIDRGRFLGVVSDYWDRPRGLERGFFFFTFRGYVQFLPDYHQAMIRRQVYPRTDQIKWDGDRIGIDVARFQIYDRTHFSWGSTPVLQHYKNWFERLLRIAHAMQEPDSTIYVSN